MTSKSNIPTVSPEAVSPNGAGPVSEDMLGDDLPEARNKNDVYANVNMLGGDDDDVDDDDDGPTLVRALTGKPSGYFRVNSAPAYTTTGRVVEYEPPGGDKEVYFVMRDLWNAKLLADDIRKVRFYVVVDQRMNPYIWPVKIADGSSTIGDKWANSAKDMAHQAMTEWIKIRGNKAASAYESKTARIDHGEPQWPEESLNDLLIMAFGSKLIVDSLDHPVVDKL
jgi:hypothetical protein